MAGVTQGGTIDPGPSADLSAQEQAAILASDSAVANQAAVKPNLKGKRVRAIPTVITKSGDHSTKVKLSAADFASKGIKQSAVEWSFKNDNFTVPVGEGPNTLSEEAAEFITSNFPTSFEYMNDGTE